MGSKYTTQSASGYAASPPSDDGATTEANKVKFSTIRTKLTDVLKTFAESINSALVTALDHSARSVTISDTAVASDNERVIEVKTSSVNITLSDAATMAAGYMVTVANQSSGSITVSNATSTDTIDLATNATQVLQAKEVKKYIVNSLANGYITSSVKSVPSGPGVIVNGKIVASVAANALTLAVKDNNGNDPSPASPVYARFPKASLTDAGFDLVPITAALSMTVSSGSTLGHASNIAQHVFVYLLNNAGAAEVAVSNLPPDYPGVFGKARLVSTTAEGGAGAADSATGVYSTTARSNVAWISVAKILTTQTTAGTWASAITQIDQAPFVIPSCAFSATGTTSTGINTYTKMANGTVNWSPDGTFASGTHKPNVAGLYEYSINNRGDLGSANTFVISVLYKNGAAGSLPETRTQTPNGAGSRVVAQVTYAVLMNGTTDYMEDFGYQNDSNPLDIVSFFNGGRVPQ